MKDASPSSRARESNVPGHESGAGAFPDFLCIGAQKCGTTWLYEVMSRHPDLWLPPQKTLLYFSHRYASRRNVTRQLFGRSRESKFFRDKVSKRLRNYKDKLSVTTVSWNVRYLFGKPSDDWYASLFKPGKGKVKGQITPGYARFTPEQVAHVRRLMPDARIIFMIRHPVERAWSRAMKRSVERGFFAPSTTNWIRNFGLKGTREKSDYLATLRVWREYYPDDQIFIGFFEDIHFHQQALLDRIYDFVGVDSARGETLTERVNPGVEDAITRPMAVHLARMYAEQIDELARRFDGYAAWWAYVVERLLEEPDSDSGDEVPYPFCKSSYWQEWLNLKGLGSNGTATTPPLQSNVLSALDRSSAAVERALS